MCILQRITHHNDFTVLFISNTENEESKFVFLGFRGEGKVQSLIAIFENGKIFGIADFSVETICHLALHEPGALSAAIRKLKFIKCNLTAELPISRAVVYNVPNSSTTSKREIDSNEAESTGKKIAETSLSIATIDAKGRLLFGSIGTTSALLSGSLSAIKETSLSSLSAHSAPKSNKCLDIAIINFESSMDAADGGDGGDADSDCESDVIALVLYSDGTVAVIEALKNVTLRTFHLDIPSPVRISIINTVRPSPPCPSLTTVNDSKSGWEGVIFGIQIAAPCRVSTNMYALLIDLEAPQESISLRLGPLGPFSSVEPASAAESEFLVASSPPGDCLFTTRTDGEGYVLTGRGVSDGLCSCVKYILAGLTDQSDSEGKSDLVVATSEADGCDYSHPSTLIGKLLSLSLSSDYTDSARTSTDQNPFRVEELLEDALNMSSLRCCGDVASVLNVLYYSVQDPPAGFLARLSDAAEVTIFRALCDC